MQDGEFFMPDGSASDDKAKREVRQEDVNDAAAAFDPMGATDPKYIPLPLALAAGFVVGIIVTLAFSMTDHVQHLTH